MNLNGVQLDESALRSFCRKWGIHEMEVFGSILREDFGPESDIDFLVSFDEGVRLSFTEILDMEDELAAIVGREVEVVERSQVEAAHANPYRRSSILQNRRHVYAG